LNVFQQTIFESTNLPGFPTKTTSATSFVSQIILDFDYKRKFSAVCCKSARRWRAPLRCYSLTCCEHDVFMVVDVDERAPTAEERIRLDSLGFTWLTEFKCWGSFRFGSA
jgi:hypothetical protein